MNNLVIGLSVVVAAISLGLVVYLIGQLIKAKDQQIADLMASREKLQSELEDLISRKRQTGPTMAAAEDAMAAIANVIVNRDIEQVRLNAALNYLQELRKGPYAYKPDQSVGPREEYK